MGNTQSSCCGGRDKVEITIEARPKATTETETSKSTTSTASNSTKDGGGGAKTESKPKLLRPQSQENVKVDAPTRQQTTKKSVAPVTPKTKLTSLSESDAEPSKSDASASPNRMIKLKSAFGDTASSALTAEKEKKSADEVKTRSPSPSVEKKKPERQSTGMGALGTGAVKTSSVGANGGPPPSASAGAAVPKSSAGETAASGTSAASPLSGSLKRVPTPAKGAVAAPASPGRLATAAAPIAEVDEPPSAAALKKEQDRKAADWLKQEMAAEAKRVAAEQAAAAPPPITKLAIDTSAPSPGHSRTPSIETPKPATPSAATPKTPKAPTVSTIAEAAAVDPAEAAAKLAAAQAASLKLKEERLARERTQSEAAAKHAAEEAEKEKVRLQNLEIAKKERDAKFAAIAEEKARVEAEEKAKKKADEAKKQAMMDNPEAVTMADKAALLATALTPKAGETTNTVEEFVKQHLSPAKESAVSGNNSKMFMKVMPEKLGAAYKTLVDALCQKENEHVTSLSMTYCSLSDDFLVQLSAALASNSLPALDTLNLESNAFGGIGLKALAAALHTNHSLRIIKLDNQKGGVFPGDARTALLAALEKNDTVTNVGLQSSGSVEERNTLDKHLNKNKARLRASSTPKAAKVAIDNPFTARMEAVRANTDTNPVFEIKEDVHRTQFMNWTAEQQQKWFADLEANSNIGELKLSGLQLKEVVITSLLAAVANNKTITKLDLSSNAMNEAAVKALVDCLKVNSTLRELRLSECKITVRSEDAIMALAESGANSTITVLKMSFGNKTAAQKFIILQILLGPIGAWIREYFGFGEAKPFKPVPPAERKDQTFVDDESSKADDKSPERDGSSDVKRRSDTSSTAADAGVDAR